MNAYAQLEVPLSVEKAQRQPDWKKFEHAMGEELEGLWEFKTIERLPNGVPKEAKVISSRCLTSRKIQMGASSVIRLA